MARPLRLDFPGALYHVTTSGNDRRALARDDEDRHRFLTLLGQTVGVFRWTLHAYVLMDNHYHLLIETPEPWEQRGQACGLTLFSVMRSTGVTTEPVLLVSFRFKLFPHPLLNPAQLFTRPAKYAL